MLSVACINIKDDEFLGSRRAMAGCSKAKRPPVAVLLRRS
jgi:hypothetical protein